MPALLLPDSKIAAPIRCIVSDVDGVMTDGQIIYDSLAVETKRFHVRDGLGIKLWLRSGFRFGILSSRTSKIVEWRAAELGVTQVRQGFEVKWPVAERMIAEFGCQPEEACYIGDDLPDIPVMTKVGLAVTPADAAADARHAAHWILRRRGGNGAVRELVERLLRAKQRWEEHARQ
jgi:YrbI family 3-deoxy-D-manno-octulosonate 8-phosphate phosphatase